MILELHPCDSKELVLGLRLWPASKGMETSDGGNTPGQQQDQTRVPREEVQEELLLRLGNPRTGASYPGQGDTCVLITTGSPFI